MSHSVTVTAWPATDVSTATLNRVSVTYGAQDLTAQPDPSTCSLELLYDSTLGTLDLENFPLGQRLIVTVTPAGYSGRVRFIGKITDAVVDRDVLLLTLVSEPLQKLARQTITLDAYAATLTDEALNIAGHAIPDLLNIIATGGTVSVSSPAIDGVNALTYCQTIASNEPAGRLFEYPWTNDFAYFRGQDARDDVTPDLTLASSEILDDWSIRRSVVQLCNRAVVVDANGIETVVENYAHQLEFGVYEIRLETSLSSTTDAEILATKTVTAGVNPAWILSGIRIPLGTLSAARQDEIVPLLVVGTVVEIPELYPGAQTVYFLEGYDETVGRGFWDVTLYLSDISASWNPQQWDDLAALLTWSAVPASTTWNDLATSSL